MDDLSNDIAKDQTVSPKMRALMRKEKSEARRRIIERGIVHFRADEQFMEALLKAAEEQKIAPGTLCRNIVWKHLTSREVSPIATDSEMKSGFQVSDLSGGVFYSGAPTPHQSDEAFQLPFAKLAEIQAEIHEIKELLKPENAVQDSISPRRQKKKTAKSSSKRRGK